MQKRTPAPCRFEPSPFVAWIAKQIVPDGLGEMISATDRTRAKRVADAMLKMVKFDISALAAAYAGTAA